MCGMGTGVNGQLMNCNQTRAADVKTFTKSLYFAPDEPVNNLCIVSHGLARDVCCLKTGAVVLGVIET